jgi:hypothetical protein
MKGSRFARLRSTRVMAVRMIEQSRRARPHMNWTSGSGDKLCSCFGQESGRSKRKSCA